MQLISNHGVCFPFMPTYYRTCTFKISASVLSLYHSFVCTSSTIHGRLWPGSTQQGAPSIRLRQIDMGLLSCTLHHILLINLPGFEGCHTQLPERILGNKWGYLIRSPCRITSIFGEKKRPLLDAVGSNCANK